MPTDDGVPLSHYVEHHPGVGVRFSCTSCQASHDVPIQDVIDRLKARGLGDARTGVRAVAGFAERPCARCGKRAWETRPAWVVDGGRPPYGRPPAR